MDIVHVHVNSNNTLLLTSNKSTTYLYKAPNIITLTIESVLCYFFCMNIFLFLSILA